MNTSTQPDRAGTRVLSLEEGHKLLALYESMLDMARTQNWERLSEIERQAAAIRDTAAVPPNHSQPEEDIDALVALFYRVQALDREIRGLIEPAREDARQHLAAAVKGRAVRNAYGPGLGGTDG
ncbi:MAG: flagellar protein FliT [Azoarcus sp.]|nr:flagellar protein FliT [Azoarcus sp.]